MTDAPWVDSHAHLTLFPRAEVPAVLARAAEAGVGGVLVPASGPSDLAAVLDLGASLAPRVVVALGVHPHEARALDAALKRTLERSLRRPGVVAVGEIGLDYHYMSSPREDQLEALAWQLDLAGELDLPVILHNRESWADLEAMLAERAGRLRGVCHSFCEGVGEARRVVELGLSVGVSGMVTFGWADHIRQAARAVGAERLLVETDSPYLAPVPHRGRRNEPAYVALVGERLAAELSVEPGQLRSATARSFRELFRLPDGWPGSLG
jgi:TatD DNase family protein